MRTELGALLGRTRVRVLLGVLFVVPVLLSLAVYLSGGPSAGRGPSFTSQIADNGVFAALAGLTVCIPVLLPMSVAVVAADTIAGEASIGTLRYLLVLPVGRVRLLGAKALGVIVFSFLAGLAIVAGGLAAGAVLFPLGPVVGLSGTTFSLASALARIVAAGAVVGASMLGLGAMGMFFSTLTDSPLAAMVVTAGLAIASEVMAVIPQLGFVHPWLVTWQWLAFADLLRSPVVWHNILADLGIQAGYVAVFATAAWARFTTKDVLS